jgi:hypothetical protein
MVKFASLVSVAPASFTLVMRIRAWVVAGPFTFQLCAPSFAVPLKSVVHPEPPLRDSSIFTFPTMPLEVQRIVRVLPIGHTSPPFEIETVIWPPIVKSVSLVSQMAGLLTLQI